MSNPGAMSSALIVSDVAVFRHEFITIFRYSHTATVHPADVHVLESIDERGALYDDEQGTVFLACALVERLRQLMDLKRRAAAQHHRRRFSYIKQIRSH